MSRGEDYVRFMEHLRSWIIGLPDSEHLMPLLEACCTPEEADFMAELPFLPHPLERIAEKLDAPLDALQGRLDSLAAKGLVFRHPSRNTVRYALNDSMFDFYRSPFWAGKSDETTVRVASLANRYYYDAFGREFGAHPTMGLRAIPVHKTIADTRQVLPYENLLQVLEQEDYFCTSHCPCRHRKNLDPEAPSCKHETFNCLHFGRLAGYMVRNNMGKEISRQETLEILEAAANEGLVHGISNTQHGMDTICNCCSCCCLFLESANKLGLYGHQPSNYIVRTRSETCKACGLCVERCPMNALSLEESPAARNKRGQAPRLDANRCIGCGVCAHKCPTQSLSLVHREGEQDFPVDFRDQGYRMAKERGRYPLGPAPR
jgi:Na+-translocating ferredoxin:NAD+ oxidoreductase subunit B